MAPEVEPQVETTDSSETQEEQDQQGTTPETGGQEAQQQEQAKPEEIKLPDDHPLVKTVAAQKQTLKDNLASLNKATKEAKEASAKVTELTAEVEKLRPVQDTLDAVQNRYDRLEAFLLAVGGPLGRALDSKTFTQKLFESDDNIKDLVKQWHRDNPSATSEALASAAGGGTPKLTQSDLLRIAAGKQ